jgi:hypothetical protein
MIETEQLRQLERRVAEYLSINIYNGYSKPFEMGDLRWSTMSPLVLCLTPKGMPEEDIMDEDTNWEIGLAEVGQEFGVTLRLEHYLFTK